MRLHGILGVRGAGGLMTALALVLVEPGRIGSAAEADAAANASAPAETLEAVAERLNKAVDAHWRLSSGPAGFKSRRDVAAGLNNWDNLFVPYIVTPASPGDRVGERPADFRGASAVEVIATDGRYTVVAGPSYEPDIAAKILAALGMTLSQEAERRRRMHSAAHWLDFRLAAVRDSSPGHQKPLPLAHGPSLEEIEGYARTFAEKGPNGGRQRGDPYLWFHPLKCCDLSPLLFTEDDAHDNVAASFHAKVDPIPYVLLSNKPDEVFLNRPSARPRPWYLKRVQAARDARGRPAVELEFDEVAAAGMARLTKANLGRALAILFDNQVVQIQVIDAEMGDKMVLSGKAFDEKLVAQMVRSLRECMVVQDASNPLAPKKP